MISPLSDKEKTTLKYSIFISHELFDSGLSSQLHGPSVQGCPTSQGKGTFHSFNHPRRKGTREYNVQTIRNGDLRYTDGTHIKGGDRRNVLSERRQ